MVASLRTRPCRRKRERGTGLIITMVMVVAVSMLMLAMFKATASRSNIETASADSWVRFNGTDAGLERARFMVKRHSNEGGSSMEDKHWLRYWAGTSTSGAPPFVRNTPAVMRPVVWNENGVTSNFFSIGGGSSGTGKVQLFVLDPSDLSSDSSAYNSWFMIVARTEMDNISSASAMLVRPRDSLSVYARYTKTNLTISADNTTYGGSVHSNGLINLTAKNAVFKGKVTAVGQINISGQGVGEEPTFENGYEENAASVSPSTSWSTIESAKAEVPNARVYDPTDATFKSEIQAATGYTPADTDKIEVNIVFENDKMTVVTNVYDSVSYPGNSWYNDYIPQYGNLKATRTETNVDTPPDTPIYVNGNAKVRGNQASRTTVVADRVYLTGPTRYVNKAGAPEYSLYENNGNVASFDTTNQEWMPSTNQKWDDPNDSTAPTYKETTGWTRPTDSTSGTSYSPVLGIVSIKGSWDISERADGTAYMNSENHAAITSINGVHHSTDQIAKAYARYYSGGGWETPAQGYNNMILGGLATYTGCPVWDRRYNHIKYDTNMTYNPPPGFPAIPNKPVAQSWHQVTTMSNGDGTVKLVNHNIVNAWK